MSVVTISSILVTFCAFFAYINYRFIKLPPTIGIMGLALVFSTILLLLPFFNIDLLPYARSTLDNINFSETLLHGMLSFLLFAGALQVNIDHLKQQKYIIGILAVFSTLLSTFCVGLIAYHFFPILGLNVTFVQALIFGALISPTDPVAVMAILKKYSIPKSLETKVVGESLFNDGVAVVIFVALLGMLASGEADISHMAILFFQEAIGGIVLGLVLGYITFLLLRGVDSYKVKILLTLALVMGGYELASLLDTSGPITMVAAGLLVANVDRAHAASDRSREYLDGFWEIIDEFLNVILFLLIGFELLAIPFNQSALIAGIILIPSLLLIRYISVFIPIKILQHFRKFTPGAINILTWGGLRGGICIALVLSLPSGEMRDYFLLVTYCIVMFSILVQGLSIGGLVKYHQSN